MDVRARFSAQRRLGDINEGSGREQAFLYPLLGLFERYDQQVRLVSQVIGSLKIRLLQGPLGLL